MSIVTADLKFYLSGGTSNTSVANSRGGARSTIEPGGVITSGLLNNLWSDVPSGESATGSTKYRCIYVRNINVATTWTNAKIWISSPTTSQDDEIDIGLGSSAINGTEQGPVNEGTAPSSVTFSRPANKGTGLTLGNIPATQHKAVWIRRVVDASAAQANNNFYILSVEGETT